MSTTTHESDKSALLSQAIEVARGRRGSGGPPHDLVDALLRAYYRRVAAEDIADRSDVDVYGAFASHYKLAGTRPQGTARVRVFTPGPSDQGWSADGHSVVEVVVDDMPFLVDSLTMELSRQLHDVHLVDPPALRRRPRHHRHPPGGAAGRRRRRRGRRGRRASASRGCTSRSTGSPRARTSPRSRSRSSGCCATCARPSRTGTRCTPRSPRSSASSATEPPAGVDADEVRQAARPAAVAGRRATSPSSATASTASSSTATDEYLRGVAGTGLGILRADQDMSASLGPAARRGGREGAREDPARAHQGQLPLDRAPPGVPRLRRRQEVRERRGGRRAPLPRALLERGLHRVADPDPAAARARRRGAEAHRVRAA